MNVKGDVVVNRVKKGKVYILTYAAHFTGGTEAAHQLCHVLRNNGFDAFMYYINAKAGENPVHELFRTYNTEKADVLADVPENYIVLPEILTDVMFMVKQMKKIIWWLSVDNYYNNIHGRLETGQKAKLLNITSVSEYDCIHFVQSRYAREHLLFHGVVKTSIFLVTDYINRRCMPDEDGTGYTLEREDVCLYAPRRGYHFVQELLNYNAKKKESLIFLPIVDMPPHEVPLYMRMSKVFIDFGNHPGMDRMPREAAINGCCVITNRDGAAAYNEDVPIPQTYKLSGTKENIGIIYELIRECIEMYDSRKEDFGEYKSIIRNQESKFNSEVIACFTQLMC